MKLVFIHCSSKPLIEPPADGPGASSDIACKQDQDLPAALRQTDGACVLEADYGNGAALVPAGFRLITMSPAKVPAERDIIANLDLVVALAMAEPGSIVTSMPRQDETLFFGALRNGVALIALGGVQTPEGRVFGMPLTPVSAAGEMGLSFEELCRSLHIPLDAALAERAKDEGAQDTSDAGSALETHDGIALEIQACAGWLAALHLVFADNPRAVKEGWNGLAQWIEDDPARAHLAHFARSSPCRRASSTADKGEPDLTEASPVSEPG